MAVPELPMAQNRIFFSVNTVDRPTDNTKIASYVTGLYKTNACLQLFSGLYAFYGIVGNKAFALDCPTSPNGTSPEIRLFPNPAINYTRIQSSALLTDDPALQLWVYDAAGRTILQRTVSNVQLLAGYSLYTGSLASGNYFLKIESPNTKKVIPFIKIN